MSECRTIAIANQKGGVGKTTTAFSLGVALSKEGKSVLLIDADPQGDLTTYMGVYDQDNLPITISTLIERTINDNEVNAEEAILHHNEGVDLIPSNINLSMTEVNLFNAMCRENAMRNSLKELKEKYDYIIIDCPPSLNMLTINSMTTANSVLVPIQCEYYALEGLSQLIHTVNLVKERLNPELEMEGVIFTMYDSRTNLSLQVVENVKNNLTQYIFTTLIPRNIRLAEAPSYGQPITIYDPKSAGAEAYMDLADELIHKNEES